MAQAARRPLAEEADACGRSASTISPAERALLSRVGLSGKIWGGARHTSGGTLALPCPIAPDCARLPPTRPPTPARPAAGPPAHRAHRHAPLHLTLPPSACGAGAPGYPAHARVAPSRLHGQGCSVRAGARGQPGCVDLDPEVIQSAYAQAIQGAEVEAGAPTIPSCGHGRKRRVCRRGTGDFLLRPPALPQRMTYGFNFVYARCTTEKIICLVYGRGACNMGECRCLERAYGHRPWFSIHKCLDARVDGTYG